MNFPCLKLYFMVLDFCEKYCVFGDQRPYQAMLPLYRGFLLHGNKLLAILKSKLDDRVIRSLYLESELHFGWCNRSIA